MRRIGIFGGSFNPPHIGHQAVAAQALDQLGLEKVIWVPAWSPPHKELDSGSPSPHDRLLLVQTAVTGNIFFEVSDRELIRKGQSFTIDTVIELRDEYSPDVEFVLIIGEDIFEGFMSWHRAEELREMVAIAVYPRGRAGDKPADFPVEIIDGNLIDVSSSDIRDRLRECRSVRYFVSEEVLAVIENEAFYPAGMNDGLSRHLLKVEESAVALAQRWGISETAARIAARHHDMFRLFDEKRAIEVMERHGEEIDEHERRSPVLLHGRLAARRLLNHQAILRFDPSLFHQTVEAVRYHTTGRSGMNPLEDVLFAADRTGKTWASVVDIPADRNQAVREVFTEKLLMLKKVNEVPHPRMLEGARERGAEI